jgi:glucokinase
MTLMFGKRHGLVADIGGTNSTLAIVDSTHRIIFKKRYPTREMKSFGEIVNDFFAEAKIKTSIACIGFAGAIPADKKILQGNNIPNPINLNQVLKETPLKKIHIINDFEAIGYGILRLDIHDASKVCVLNMAPISDGPIALIGAGTGLGIGYLVPQNGKYIPYPSEGGHTCMHLETEEDYAFREFLIKQKHITNPVLEDSLSGRAIGFIYEYLKNNRKFKQNKSVTDTIAKAKDQSAVIASQASNDELCKATMKWFTQYYARATRDLVMTFLPKRVFIAGGIASKNINTLQKDFLSEYMNHKAEWVKRILEKTPIFVVLDYDVSLYGCAVRLFNYD